MLEPIRVALEEARFDTGGRLHLRGWALAARGLRRIDVFFAERRRGVAETGLPRADVAAAFPDYPDAPLSGFALTLPLPAEPIADDFVTVVAIDRDGESLSSTLPASIPAAGESPGAPLLVMLEDARITDGGALRVRGWAVCVTAIESVEVFLGSQPLGGAIHNLSREDVGRAHPAYPNADRAGFLLEIPGFAQPVAGRSLRVVVAAQGGHRDEVTATL